MINNNSSCISIFVNGIFKNKEGDILMVKRSLNDRLLPGYYEFPGGRLQEGENLEIALRRKFLQEIGLNVEVIGFTGSRMDNNKHGDYLRVFFNVGLYDGSLDNLQIKLNSSHDDYIWYKKSRSNIKIAPDCAHIINADSNREAVGSVEEVPHHETNRHYDSLIVYTDGGSRGNPGPSAAAYVILDDKERIIDKGGQFMGHNTNDQAEYLAVKLALQASRKFSPIYIHIRLDSMLVVNQIKGIYKIKNKSLLKIHQDIKELISSFQFVDLKHVSRDYNRLADAQVNKILDYNEV